MRAQNWIVRLKRNSPVLVALVPSCFLLLAVALQVPDLIRRAFPPPPYAYDLNEEFPKRTGKPTSAGNAVPVAGDKFWSWTWTDADGSKKNRADLDDKLLRFGRSKTAFINIEPATFSRANLSGAILTDA